MQKPSARLLLNWYDKHRRILPWRAAPETKANPYHVWLSEIMLQQTVVKAVIPYFEKFLRRWPTLQALAAANDDDIMAAWAGLGYYSRARKLIECAKAVNARSGFPESAEELVELPGIGPYTSAAIAAIAFNQRAAVVDGNVERVIARVYAIEIPLPKAKQKIRDYVAVLTPANRPGDFAQAMMDLGATICTPRNPACPLCPWNKNCLAFARDGQARFPIKIEKKKRETRRVSAFWITRDRKVLLRRRPARGLLGGMMEVPSEGWRANFKPSTKDAPVALPYKKLEGIVTHTFTHFEAEITVFVAQAPKTFKTPKGFQWHPVNDLTEAGLPSVMMKVVRYALKSVIPAKAGIQK